MYIPSNNKKYGTAKKYGTRLFLLPCFYTWSKSLSSRSKMASAFSTDIPKGWWLLSSQLPKSLSPEFIVFGNSRLCQPAPYTVKKGFAVFPSPAGMSLTKLYLDGNMFPLLSLKFSLSQAGILTESFWISWCFCSQTGVFPDIPLLQGGILPRSLITHLCTCYQPAIFPYFPLLGSLPLST